MAGAPAVVLDQRDTGCQVVVDLTHHRIAVLHLQVAEGYPRNEYKRRSLTGYGEGQGHSIAAASIAQLRRNAPALLRPSDGNSPTLSEPSLTGQV